MLVTCPKDFGTKQACHLHMNRKHQWQHEAYKYAPGTFCACCLLEFHSRNRVLQHLMYKSPTCLANLKLRGPLVTSEELQVLNQQARLEEAELRKAGLRRSKAKLLVIRLSGPVWPIINFNEESAAMHPRGRSYRWHSA
mmetsp:Transcript_28774/g.51244  ORF Transcript_28774/g.51244 Transcript_28774/m.51244 type:complete len:139 (-) Transcript_28774:48-464(-)